MENLSPIYGLHNITVGSTYVRTGINSIGMLYYQNVTINRIDDPYISCRVEGWTDVHPKDIYYTPADLGIISLKRHPRLFESVHELQSSPLSILALNAMNCPDVTENPQGRRIYEILYGEVRDDKWAALYTEWCCERLDIR